MLCCKGGLQRTLLKQHGNNEFALSKQIYENHTGRGGRNGDIIAYHVRQSFKPGEISPQEWCLNSLSQRWRRWVARLSAENIYHSKSPARRGLSALNPLVTTTPNRLSASVAQVNAPHRNATTLMAMPNAKQPNMPQHKNVRTC